MIRLSPSLIALYFHYECPRYLIYRASSDIQKKVTGKHDFISEHSPVTRAIMKGGYLWEEEVVEKKLKKKALVAEKGKSKKTRDRVFEVDDTLTNLRNIKEGKYLYQGTLETPASFYKEFGIDQKEISFSNCRPDLIECFIDDGKKCLGIIDVKASA